MNILFVHEVDWLEKVVFEVHNLSELLSKRGHRVYAIDYSDTWRREGLLDFGTLKTSIFEGVHRAYDDASVTLIRPGFVKLSGLSRASAFLTSCYTIQGVIEDKGVDAVILYSVPTNGLQTVSIAQEFGVPVLFRSIDILHRMVPHIFLRYPTYLLEKFVYRRVDRVLALTPKLMDYVIGMGADRDKVEFLPPGVDIEMFHPAPRDENLMEKLGLGEEDRVILFIGTLFDFSGLDLFLERFPLILKEVPQARFLIVGGGPLYGKLKDLTERMGLSGYVVFTGFQPYADMPRYINLASVCLNPFQLTRTTRDIIPTKILQYLACAKPVVATPLPGMMSILPDEDVGVIYAEGIHNLASNVLKLLKDDEEGIGRRGYRHVMTHHSWDTLVSKLERILNEML